MVARRFLRYLPQIDHAQHLDPSRMGRGNDLARQVASIEIRADALIPEDRGVRRDVPADKEAEHADVHRHQIVNKALHVEPPAVDIADRHVESAVPLSEPRVALGASALPGALR